MSKQHSHEIQAHQHSVTFQGNAQSKINNLVINQGFLEMQNLKSGTTQQNIFINRPSSNGRGSLKTALKDNDITEVADALTDILYVTYGAGHAFGINLDQCFNEVQNSNMSKLGDDGKPIYSKKGKVLKGPNYFKPNLSNFRFASSIRLSRIA